MLREGYNLNHPTNLFVIGPISGGLKNNLKAVHISIEEGEWDQLNNKDLMERVGCALWTANIATAGEEMRNKPMDHLCADLLNRGVHVVFRWPQPEGAVPSMAELYVANGIAFKKNLVDSTLKVPGQYEIGNDGMPPFPHVKVLLGYAAEDGPVLSEIISALLVDTTRYSSNGTMLVNAVDRDGKNCQLQADHEILVRRAFAQFERVELRELSGGRSNATRVFVAYPWKYHWQQPRFVKLGPREDTIAEFKAYAEGVEAFIPYHLHPRLVAEQCALGNASGILVGDYVAHTDRLTDRVNQTDGPSVIAALFSSTLQQMYEGARQIDAPIPPSRDLVRIKEPVTAPRIDAAKRICGRDLKTFSELIDLADKIGPGPYWAGSIHGDLNAFNVLARGADAIVIDFEKSKMGPVLYDIACLEASLSVECLPDMEFSDWYSLMKMIFTSDFPRHPTPDEDPHGEVGGLLSTIRSLRAQAGYWSRGEGQYPFFQALVLLQNASRGTSDVASINSRYAAFYAFADSILCGMATRGKDAAR